MYRLRAVNITSEKDIFKELEQIGCDRAGVAYMVPKGMFHVFKLEKVPVILANIVKQEMLAKGGEAAVARGVINHSIDYSDVILMGTVKQYRQVIKKLKAQPFGLNKLAETLAEGLKNVAAASSLHTIKARGKEIGLGKRTLVMGILNVTPDSFSDGGKFNIIDQAIEHALKMVEEGADIIDIGGESTRPNHEPLALQDELERVVPILKALVKEIDVPLSIDTYKAEMAKQALDIGVHIVNDVWGLRADADMAKVCASYDAPIIIMHNQKGTAYHDLIGDMVEFFEHSIDLLVRAGGDPSKVILDPGIGFGKNTSQNIEVMRRIEEFKALGKPILLGTSRKSFIGNTLNLPVSERIEGTGATVALGIGKGVEIVRVHDVKEMARVAKMTDAIVRGE